jgi:hypothetical protein
MDNQRRLKLGARFKTAGSSGKKAHVIARQGHWVVFKEGANKVVAEYPTKEGAFLSAKKILKSGQTEMVVLHKPDGSVEKIQIAV